MELSDLPSSHLQEEFTRIDNWSPSTGPVSTSNEGVDNLPDVSLGPSARGHPEMLLSSDTTIKAPTYTSTTHLQERHYYDTSSFPHQQEQQQQQQIRREQPSHSRKQPSSPEKGVLHTFLKRHKGYPFGSSFSEHQNNETEVSLPTTPSSFGSLMVGPHVSSSHSITTSHQPSEPSTRGSSSFHRSSSGPKSSTNDSSSSGSGRTHLSHPTSATFAARLGPPGSPPSPQLFSKDDITIVDPVYFPHSSSQAREALSLHSYAKTQASHASLAQAYAHLPSHQHTSSTSASAAATAAAHYLHGGHHIANPFLNAR